MTYKIVIPYYTNINLLRNCMKQMDIGWNHILLVDNSKNSEATKEFDGKNGLTVLTYPENIGVAKSWNLGLRAKCDWTFFVSINAAFPNGFSEVLAELNRAGEYCMLTDLAWHCNAISRKCVEKVGYFDENFYPAYYEDTDYYRRMCLAGLEVSGDQPVISIPAETMRQANSLEGGLKLNFRQLAEYYAHKWGGYPGEETFETPFGKPENTLHHWTRQSLGVLKELQGFEDEKEKVE